MKLTIEQIEQIFKKNGIQFKRYKPPKLMESFNRFIVFEAGKYEYCITWYANMSTLNLGAEPNINSSFKFIDMEMDDWWFEKGIKFKGVSGDDFLVALKPMRST